ncbi:MAG: hypothetical protein HKN04_09870 [Rhodothermaceae bacterium]|nr:hypothetical protein [Rhodothermaceae bacterium]
MRAVFLLLAASQLLDPASAQDLTRLSNGVGFHPVTESGRVVWTEGPTPDALQLNLWDGRNTIILDEQISGALPGWPDLDADGRVAYVKVVGGRYQLMLWDGRETVQLTNSGSPDAAIDLGTPTSELKGGFPRIAVGDVVFSDAQGNVFLYETADQSLRAISEGPAQRVARTTADFRAVMQQTGTKPVFYYDGRYIVWMHQEPGGHTSEFTVYQADAEDGYTPRAIASFTAATPQEMNAAVAGAAFDPYFVACGPEIAWMYRAPGTGEVADLPAQYAQYAAVLNDVVIGYYDGSEAREVARGDLMPLNLGLSDGHLAWIEFVEGNDDSRLSNEARLIQSHRDGRTTTVARVEDPPMQAANDARVWSGPNGLHVIGSEVLWFEDEARCEQMVNLPGVGTPCAWIPTFRIALFTRTGGPGNPQRVFRLGDLLLGGSFDAGRYAWRDDANRVATTELIAGLGGDGGLLQLTDLLRVDRIPLGPDEPRAKLVDAFSLRAARTGGECTPGGGGASDAALLRAVTFDVMAEDGILPDLSDIAALRLYEDRNQNRQLDAGDVLLDEATALAARQTMELGEPMPILPGSEVHFLVEMELKDATELCPCNEYRVALDAADVDAGTLAVQGSTAGALVLPNVELHPVWGDGQAALPTTRLENPLGFRVENLPARCVDAARFRFVHGVAGDDAVLSANGEEGTDLEVDLVEAEAGLEAEVNLTLGQREGAYTVEASLLYPEETACEPPMFTFVAHAGTFVLQVLDANDPAFVNATAGPNHADYDSWTVTLTDDLNRLADGGKVRSGTTADGLSPLLLRARLIGLTEAPEGEVTFTMNASDDSGLLSPGLGETIPVENGTESVSAEWVMTEAGPVAVALYTPPFYLSPASATERVVTFTASYQMPGATEVSEEEERVLVYRPPVLFTHGMWSGPEAWSSIFTGTDPRFETFVADYSSRSAENFDALGGVMRSEIQRVRDDLNSRGIAVTQVNVVAHSMGGLITRQYIGENRGAGFRRPDTFGQGDIYALITVGTPHYGSPIAWLTLTLRDPQYNYFSPEFIEAVNYLGLDIWSGAVDAMCPGSDALQALGRTHVPTHTLRAWYFDSQTETTTWGAFLAFFDSIIDSIIEGAATGEPPTPLALVKYTVEYGGSLVVDAGLQGLYGSQRTDYLVTLEGQSGGITQGYRLVFPETLHSAAPGIAEGETTSEEVAGRVFYVLSQSPENIEVFARSLPPPIVETDYITCQ